MLLTTLDLVIVFRITERLFIKLFALNSKTFTVGTKLERSFYRFKNEAIQNGRHSVSPKGATPFKYRKGPFGPFLSYLFILEKEGPTQEHNKWNQEKWNHSHKQIYASNFIPLCFKF